MRIPPAKRKQAFVVVAGSLTALLVAFSLNPFLRRGAGEEFRYRFTTGPKETLAQQIHFYETRVARGQANGIDLAILADLYFDEGRRTGDTAHYDHAETIAKKSLAALPSPNLAAKGVLAKVAAARHLFTESVRIGQEMLKENPASEGAQAVLATAYLAMGELVPAQQYADQLALNKPIMSNLALRGLVLLAQGREDEGVFELQHALRAEEFGEASESAWTRAILGRHYLRRGQLEMARALFSESLRISPEYPLALDLLGQLEQKQRHYAKAESYFNEAFAVSHQIPYLLHLSEATGAKGQPGAAEALRAQAEDLIRRELTGGAYGHRLDLVRVLLTKNAPNAASEAVTLAQAETQVRHNSETFYVLSLAQTRAHHLREAREAIAASLRAGGREPEYYYQAAALEQAAGSKRRAEFYLGETRKQNPFFEPPAETLTPLAKAQAR